MSEKWTKEVPYPPGDLPYPSAE